MLGGKAVLEARSFDLEVVEGEVSGESQTLVGRGDERVGRYGGKGTAGFAGLDLEAVPERVGDLAERAFGDEMEVEKDKRNIAVA